MTTTNNRLTVAAVAVATAALLLGAGAFLGPGSTDGSNNRTAAGSTGAPTDGPVAAETGDTAPEPTPTAAATPTEGSAGRAMFEAVPAGVGLQSQVGADGAEIEITVDDAPDAAWVLPLCADGGAVPQPVDMVTTVETGPEYARHWQVAVLASDADAAAVLAAFAAAAEGCTEQVGAVATAGADDLTMLGDLGLGDGSLLGVARPVGAEASGQSEFRSYLGLVQESNTVILVAESGEFHEAPTLDDFGVQAVNADVHELLDGLCADRGKRCGTTGHAPEVTATPVGDADEVDESGDPATS